MAITLSTETVEVVEVDRTWEFSCSTPVSGQYVLSIYRHVVDSNTGRELRRDELPVTMTLAEMAADPDLAPLLSTLPAIFDRIVTAKRAAQ